MDVQERKTKYIEMKTSLPGPQAQKLLERRMASIPRGPFNTVPTFAAKGKEPCSPMSMGIHLSILLGQSVL